MLGGRHREMSVLWRALRSTTLTPQAEPRSRPPMEILTIETPSLGDRSYVVTDRVLEVTEPRGLKITHVLETHNHNDYVTGGYELVRLTGATYVISAAEEMFYDFHGVDDGDTFRVGELEIEAMHTPGHTPTHMSYVVRHGGQTTAFTGGSLLYGSVGRTDLVARSMAE